MIRSVLFATIALAAVFVLGSFQTGNAASSGGLEPGLKYCPAPWGDNAEFIDTHFGVDAKTGKVTKYTGTVHPDETGDFSSPGEQVLYVAPPVNVENRFVPPPGWEGPPPAAPQRQRVARQPARARNNQYRQVPAPSRSTTEVASDRVRERRAEPAAPRVSDTSRSGSKKQPWWRAIRRN